LVTTVKPILSISISGGRVSTIILSNPIMRSFIIKPIQLGIRRYTLLAIDIFTSKPGRITRVSRATCSKRIPETHRRILALVGSDIGLK